MAEEKEIMQAKAVYDTLCNMLTENKWHYEGDEDNFVITCGAQGEDLPIKLTIRIDPERLLISIISPMPFTVPEDKRIDMALAVSIANYGLVDGSFDYSFANGNIYFRMTSSFMDSLIGKELFDYMVFVSCGTIDRFNDKFLMIIKDKMTLDELVKYTKE